MSRPEVLEKIPMNVVEVRAALDANKAQLAEGEELNFRAQKMDEYVQDVARLKPKQAKELYDKLIALDIPRLKEAHVHKFIDLLPVSERQVKVILSGYHLTVTGENVHKIVETISEFAPKK